MSPCELFGMVIAYAQHTDLPTTFKIVWHNLLLGVSLTSFIITELLHSVSILTLLQVEQSYAVEHTTVIFMINTLNLYI